MVEKVFISSSLFSDAMRSLAARIDEMYSVHTVVGIARGGLPGATYLSHHLDAQLEVIHAGHYDKQQRKDNVTIRGDVPRLDGNVLIFDDVVDTGMTMHKVWSKINQRAEGRSREIQVKTASMHVKPERSFDPDYYVEEADEWIVYPWEETR